MIIKFLFFVLSVLIVRLLVISKIPVFGLRALIETVYSVREDKANELGDITGIRIDIPLIFMGVSIYEGITFFTSRIKYY